MNVLFFFPLLLAAYLCYIYWRYGMTKSISATAKKHRYGWEKAAFAAALWLGIAIPFIVLGIETARKPNFEFLWFLAGAGIAFVGAAQVFWNGGMEYRVHMIGTYAGIVLGMLAILITISTWWAIVLVVLFSGFALQMLPFSFIKKYRLPNHIYWVEVAAICTVELTLIITQL